MRRLQWLGLVLLLTGCTCTKVIVPLTPAKLPAMRAGYDVLAVAKYCNTYLNAPKLPVVSTLLSTFGDPLPCIEKRIKQGGLEIVQVDLIDATCWRNSNCPPGSPRPDDLGAIRQRARLVNRLAIAYPDVEFWLSPALEHDVKDASRVRAMLDAAQNGCPTCRVINSPFTGARPDPYRLELHGTTVKAFSVSADGKSSFDADTLNGDGNGFNFTTSGSYTTFAWWPELNLRCTGEEHFTPPMSRTERPTADQFTQAYLVTQPQEAIPAAPAVCKTVVRVKAPEIYKPNAESYCNGQRKDSRGNKPLLIINRRGSNGEKLTVIDRNGSAAGCFQYYGPFGTANLQRWYMGSCSNQTPARLYRDLKGEWGFVKLDKNKCLLINSVRRLGSYR